MKFRPCIDIHNGKVKQIVGGSLRDQGGAGAAARRDDPAHVQEEYARENFVSELEADSYARLYCDLNLTGGHVILLNPVTSPMYEATRQQALKALKAAPGTLQLGGGITPANAGEFLDAGATHVIVTSYVFRDGQVDFERLEEMVCAVGKERLVLDLSCRKAGNSGIANISAADVAAADIGEADTVTADPSYFIVTNRWQTFTQVPVTIKTLDMLSGYCSEFLIHAADVEGQVKGPELPLVDLLGSWDGIPVTYAGGIGSFQDLEEIKRRGRGRVDITIGSALDLFGGTMEFSEVLRRVKE